MMETIRVTPDEQQRIATAAAGTGVSKQRFCHTSILEKVKEFERRPPAEAELAEGMVRLRQFQEPFRDVGRSPHFPRATTSATQYQTDGEWYFFAANFECIGMMENEAMQAALLEEPPQP